MPIVRDCIGCGKSFATTPSRGNRKYCSVACRRAASAVINACLRCGSNFRVSTSRVRLKFCSITCYRTSLPPRQPIVCDWCGGGFAATQKARRKFCSHACYSASKAIPTTRRFWSKVDRSAGPNGCWPWTARLDEDGYGEVYISKAERSAGHPFRGSHVGSHRVAWWLDRGSIGALWVLHTCHNRACCNVAHLYLGTHADNMRDMVEAGRQAKGERNGFSRLKTWQVKILRETRTRGESLRPLARQWGLSNSAVEQAANGVHWKHIR